MYFATWRISGKQKAKLQHANYCKLLATLWMKLPKFNLPTYQFLQNFLIPINPTICYYTVLYDFLSFVNVVYIIIYH